MNELLSLFSPKTCYFLFGVKIPFYFHYFLAALVLYKPISFIIGNRHLKFLVIFLIPTLILFELLRNGFFFQSDDFAHLKIAAEWSFWDVLSKGMITGAIWGFHHIFVGFWLFKSVFIFFGTKLEAYLLVNYFLHLLNISLIYLILNKIKKTPAFSVLVGFLFGMLYLSWISNMHELVAGTFFLATILLWLTWLLVKRKKYLYFAIISFLLALVSKEITFLLPLILFLISISYHNYVAKLDFKRVTRSLFPFFVISGVHFFLYGKIFLTFFTLGQDGYKTTLSTGIFLENLTAYTTKVFPVINFSIPIFLTLVVIVAGFDLWKKKLLLTPLFVSYFLLIAAPATFGQKFALYYVYIPSIPLYLMLFIFLREIYYFLGGYLKKEGLKTKAFNVYFVLIIALVVFRVDIFLMDRCFLVQFPWQNPHRVAVESLTAKINGLFLNGEIKGGEEIKLEGYEITHEIEYLFTTNGLYLFLKEPGSINYTFVFNEENKSLEVKEESVYHKMSF